MRLYKTLLDQRTQWIQRIHAELFQHGVALPDGEIRSDADPGVAGRPALAVSAGGPSAHQRPATP